jgi:hypothetical protein
LTSLFDADLLELLTALRAAPDSPESKAAMVLRTALESAHALEQSGAAGVQIEKPVAAKADRGRYFTLISIDIRHGFFNRSDGVCDELVIQPTAQTSRQLALFGLIPRQRRDGIDILWSTGLQDEAVARLRPLVDLIAAVPAAARRQVAESIGQQLFGQPLFFVLSAPNPLFANFTEMPDWFRIGDRPLLLSNRAATPRREAHNEADLIVDWNLRAKRPRRGEAAIAMPAWAREQAARKKEALVRAASLEIGYSLVAGDTGAGKAGSLVATRSRRFALLDIHLVRKPGSPPAPAGQWDGMPISFDPGGDERDEGGCGIFHPSRYTLRFDARQTHWRYIVAARSGELDAGSLAVFGPDGEDARFALAKDLRTLPDGRRAACLASPGPLPILARPKAEHAFALVRKPGEQRPRPRTLVDPLPAAGVASISPEPPQVWSDIYVFV